MRVESIAAYDLTPGAPEHPKGEASGYLITLGGRRILFAGVTECVPETPGAEGHRRRVHADEHPAAADDAGGGRRLREALRPKVVYLQHYDNGAVAAITGATAPPPDWLPTATVADSLQAFRNGPAGSGVEVRLPDWYAAPAK